MKGLTRILIAACLCCAVGCNSEIPTEEMPEIDLSQTSCDMQISASQAKTAGEIVNKKSDVSDEKYQDDYMFNSQNMIKLYDYVSTLKSKKDDEQLYCVCGTDVCDAGIGCVLQDGAYTCAGFDKKAVDEGECSPILIEQRYLGYLVVTRLLPVLKELMIVRDLSKKVLYSKDKTDSSVRYVWSVVRSLYTNDNVKKYFYKSIAYQKNLTALDNGSDLIVSDFMNNDDNYNIVGSLAVLGAMAECQNGNSGFCPEEKYYSAKMTDVQVLNQDIAIDNSLPEDQRNCQEMEGYGVCLHFGTDDNGIIYNIDKDGNPTSPKYPILYYYHKSSDNNIDIMYPFEDFAKLGMKFGVSGAYESRIKNIFKSYLDSETEFVCNFGTEENCQICSTTDTGGNLLAGPEPCRQIFPKDGLVFHLNGTSTNTSKTEGVPKRIYSGYRQIAARLLRNMGEFDKFDSETDNLGKSYKDYSILELADLPVTFNPAKDENGNIIKDENGNTIEIPDKTEDKIAEIIDKFLVDQTYYLLTAKTNLDKLLADVRLQRLLVLLFKDPAGANVIELIDSAYVKDMNGEYIEDASADRGYRLAKGNEQGTHKQENDGYVPDKKGTYIRDESADRGYRLAIGNEKGTHVKISRTKLSPEDINNDDGIVIMNALKNMFSYSYGDYFADNPELFEAHRLFFAQYMLSSLSSDDQNYLFEMTFTQNNRCVDHKTPTGQVVGINQYCSDIAFRNNVFTLNDLTNAVFGSGKDKEFGVNNAAALADGIIMDSEFELKKSKPAENAKEECSAEENVEALYSLSSEQVQKIVELFGKSLNLDKPDSIKGIDVVSAKMYLGDEKGTNPLTVKIRINDGSTCPKVHEIQSNGTWISHRCPMGASCTENNECGMCSNSEIPHNYGWFRGQETMESEFNAENDSEATTKYEWINYTNATCERGMLKSADEYTEPTPQDTEEETDETEGTEETE